jgi:hypothetical protein
VDVGVDVVDDGLDDLLLPHPVAATPTARMLAPKLVAMVDAFTIDSFAG